MKIIDQINTSGNVLIITDNPLSEISKHVVKVNNSVITTSTSPSLIYYTLSSDTVVPGRAIIQVNNLTSNTCYIFSATVFTNPNIEFWSDDFNPAGIDTAYDGGTWSNGVIMDALGVNPEDLIIDGDAFMSPSVSFAPEELVPGHTADSLGINVYTKGPDSYATVVAGVFNVVAGQTTTVVISTFPDAYSGIRVTYGGQIFNRSTVTNSLSTNTFFIDGRYLIIPPQTTSGKGEYVFVRIGGIGLIDQQSIDIPRNSSTSTGIVESLAAYEDVEYVYVMLNGKEIGSTVTSGAYYTLKRNFNDSYRASVQVYNLNTATSMSNTIEAWFFSTPYVKFNKMNEEVFQIITPTSNVNLAYPPGSWEPFSDKVLVEISNSSLSTVRRRLEPPYTSNYTKSNDNRVFDIDNRSDNGIPLNYLSTITAADIFVYANGVRIRPGYDFNFNLSSKTIELVPNLYPDGTYISIVALGGSSYDYVISGNILQFRESKSNNNVKVTTFNNHDQLFMNNEVFDPNGVNLYQLEYPVQDESYVWVYVDGIPIIHKTDFEVLSDNRTLRIAPGIVGPSSRIMVTSIKNPEYMNKVYGYRIFKDFFGRDHFKRLSAYHTTFLTDNAKFYDTKIKVFDSTILSPTNPSRNIPGVVLIDRERIEFFNQDFDELQDLRRGTLGTSPAFYLDEGTKVIDQGIFQTIPYWETEFYYSTITTTASVYTIPVFDVNDTSTTFVPSNLKRGITLNTSTSVLPVDQVTVFFGGHQLKKASYQKYYEKINDVLTIPKEFEVEVLTTSLVTSTVTTSVYGNIPNLLRDEVFKVSFHLTDSNNTTSYWTTSSIITNNTLTSTTGTLGTSTVVWSSIYSETSGTVFGFSNLAGSSIESTITVSLLYQHLTLNIRDRLEPGVHLYLTKKEGYVWNQNQSLLESNDNRSKFIREKEAELPDVYFYGGDPRLLDANNVPLTLDPSDNIYTDKGATLRRY